MRGKFVAVGVLATVGALGVGSMALASSAAPDITRAQTLVVRGTITSVHGVNLGSRSFGPGDQFVLTERLSQQGTTIGSLAVHCTVVSRDLLCELATTLPKGEITSAGTVPGNGGDPGVSFTLAITGGTGAYQNVRGQLAFKQLTRQVDRQTYELLP